MKLDHKDKLELKVLQEIVETEVPLAEEEGLVSEGLVVPLVTQEELLVLHSCYTH